MYNNIPTDLLRALVQVVDERSFTRAAHSLGVTQPAVSAQIKRLQLILGDDLFDRAGHGVTLTAKGDLVVNYARRMLSINDLILHVTEPSPAGPVVRVGVPEDFIGENFPGMLADFRRQWPDLQFKIRHGGLETLLQELRQGHLDIAVGLSLQNPEIEARHRWAEQAVWLRSRATSLNVAAPVPLVSFREDWVCHRVAVSALNRLGRDCELVFTAPTIASLAAAVSAGLGIMALVRSRVRSPDLMVWDDPPLPKLPELSWGVYVREGSERGPFEEIADSMASTMCARGEAAAKQASARLTRNRPLEVN